MLILSLESSCDETAAAVVENGRHALSSIVASQIPEHQIYGGVVPEIASRRHIEAVCGVTREALIEAKVSLSDIDAIAVTAYPGLIGALLVGVNYAKGLSFAAKKPLIPVHHLRSHVAANYLAHPDLKPPFLCLIASGGHSHLVEVLDYTQFRVIGRTRDDAAGEAFDKAARSMGLPYPGGVHLDKIAEQGDPDAFRLPHPKVEGSPYDFSFSGLKTAVINLIHNTAQKGGELPVPDLAASFRKAVVDILCDRVLRAAEDFGYRTVVLAGGVSANRALRRKLKGLCEQRGYAFYLPPLSLCGDNAAMVGSQGYYEYLSGNLTDLSLNACASMDIC